MTLAEIIADLSPRLNQSRGLLIALDSGKQRAFRRTAEYVEDDLATFERDWKLKLPPEYREVLLRLGACELWYGGGARGISIHRLEHLPELYADFLGLPREKLFEEFLPVGCDYGLQEVAAVAWKQPGPHHLFLVSQEREPATWPDLLKEPGRLTSLAAWLSEIAAGEGEARPHGA